jgi:copper chaperone CopZ
MKHIQIYILIFLLLIVSQVKAQFKSAELYVSGLTCSMCSFATEKSLRTLDFIADVKPDLNKNLFVLTFKADKPVSIDQIQAKVKSAGFSVHQLVAVFNFNNVKIKDGFHYTYNGEMYEFMKVSSKTLNGDTKLTILDKGFVADDQYKKLSKDASHKCYQSGHTESCCPVSSTGVRQRVYHVTI